MKRTLTRLVVVLLIVATFVGVGSFVNAGSYAHASPKHPLAYCNTTTWTNRLGQSSRWDFQAYSVTMAAELAILVDSVDHIHYCGEVKSQAIDTLNWGCSNFEGAANSTLADQGSVWGPIFHCTATTYNFTGPVWFAPVSDCQNSEYMYAFADDAPTGTETVYSTHFICDN